jgi:tetratricopeptide (TPR) repeat protein
MLAPDNLLLQAERADVDLEWRADTKPLHDFIQNSIAATPAAEKALADWWFYLAMCERDRVALARALALLGPDSCQNEDIPFPHSWCEGVAAHVTGDIAAAEAAFRKTRAEAERMVADQPTDAGAISVLAVADAALGKKDEAIREGRRAVELLPIKRDAINGNVLVENLALVYAWTGEKELANNQLKIVVDAPSYISYGHLRLHPFWDAMRGDARFEEIVQSLAPTEAKR